MTIKSFSVVTSYQVLNEITSKLNGARKHPAGSLNGMFFRRQDFESSTKQVMQRLHSERILALRYANRGYASDDFTNAAHNDGVRPYTRTGGSDGNSSFSTYDLSPALRHFLNDYCRILEPLVKLLAQKHSDVPARYYIKKKSGKLASFNEYIKRLDDKRIKTPLNHEYFIRLYDELWNDYKHAESAGVQATGWSSNGSVVTSEPRLSSVNLVYFKDMHVKDFVEKSLDNMNELLDYIAQA